jgi:two-component system, NarL family, nitrate/nitrite response regulator NarL
VNRLRFVVADDHRMFADALRMLLRPLGEVVGFATTASELIRMVDETVPDFVITDVSMPDATGIDAIRRMRRNGVTVPMLVLSVHADSLLIQESVRAGADGYVLKSAAFGELVEAITTVRRGERYLPRTSADTPRASSPLDRLSTREAQVLRLMARGLTARQIAQELGITPRTVVFHKERMRERLGVATASDATELYRSLGQ